jgi:hypothetical protein
MVRPSPGASKVRKLIDDGLEMTITDHGPGSPYICITEIGFLSRKSSIFDPKVHFCIKLRKSSPKNFAFGLRFAHPRWRRRPTPVIVPCVHLRTLTHLTTVMRDPRSGQGDLTRRHYRSEGVPSDNRFPPVSKVSELNRYPRVEPWSHRKSLWGK